MLDVVHGPGERVRSLLALDQPERQVEPRGHAAGREDVAVVHHPRVADHLANGGLLQVVEILAVGDRRTAVEQAGRGQEERPGADRRDGRSGGLALGDDGRQDAALHLGPGAAVRVARGPGGSRDDEQLGTLAQLPVGDDDQALPALDSVGGAVGHERDVEPTAGQGLVRADRVHLVEGVVEQDLGLHGGNRERFRARV
jgi:hypothetical protein